MYTLKFMLQYEDILNNYIQKSTLDGVPYMRISSIISEYNPFHEGHKYHMENAKKITNSDYTIVIMSGDFTQRGTPAIIDKYARARQALYNGADLVLELPVCFATASAEGFSFGAVSILDKLGVVDSLVFGSESGDIDRIKNVADFLANEPTEYQERLQFFLKQGLSFPKARACVLGELFPDLDGHFLSSSNNILGIEYCRALKYFNSSITPMTITRKDNLYNDEELTEVGKLSSATAIRKVLNEIDCSISQDMGRYLNEESFDKDAVIFKKNTNFNVLNSYIPESSLNILKDNWGISAPISSNDFSLLLKYKLLLENRESLADYLDVTPNLADRICNHLNSYKDFDSFCNLLKTKELTYTRIARSLIHILLDIKKADYELYKKETLNSENVLELNTDKANVKDDVLKNHKNYGQYARILGFRKEASPLLHEIKKHSSILLISKLSDSVKELDGIALSMLEKDIQAAHIYESVVADKFGLECKNEFRRQLVIV